jgi:broad specificity polyphosphatase/5'/3'-nucleotidase SurE
LVYSREKNCELHFIADGARLYTFDFVVKEGRDFTISSQWLMAKDAKVIVTTKNRREAIFNINVPRANVSASNAREITRRLGDYTIEFRVFKNTVYKNRIQYQHALFKNSKRPSAWKNVDKKKLLDDLKATTADPREVNQEAAGFCGATAIG